MSGRGRLRLVVVRGCHGMFPFVLSPYRDPEMVPPLIEDLQIPCTLRRQRERRLLEELVARKQRCVLHKRFLRSADLKGD